MAAADLLSQRSPAVRSRPGYASLAQAPATPSSPHTPLLSRSLSSQYGSPSSYRTEDDHVVYEIGARYLRAGFAGESAPKAIWKFGPETSKRSGDFNRWLDSSLRTAGIDSISDWELWDYDVKNLDLGLVEAKLERALRVLHARQLMLDLRSRSAILTLPPCLPNALIGLVLKAIFTGVNSPKSVYLMSSPVVVAVGAGLRSALVVDIGWHETTVTAVYEYREVLQRRSIRGGKMLARQARRMLQSVKKTTNHLPFPTVDDLCTRYLWCRPLLSQANEPESRDVEIALDAGGSTSVPFQSLSTPVEAAFFGTTSGTDTSDDHDLAVPTLIWRTLLALPFDVRSICLSRIVVTGDASHMPGLKPRLIQEVEALVEKHGWDPILKHGKASNVKLTESAKLALGTGTAMPVGSDSPKVEDEVDEGLQGSAAQVDTERDEITEKLEREAARSRSIHMKGSTRGIDSLGAWAGASLVGALRLEGTIEIKKEDFLKSGMNVIGYPI
ncbi:hypothetical protein CAC42_2185 [Sphaceloma murrayae]|uniref:Actin-like ATPase domain-containing protein n=1 Tax=Sphaceloma murrayae TaxID=2082308 RepID=A0A2K1QIH9_9PEZI|nr:hypothetical protein CAC42_2185 [Sphaceloma murrayae]